MHYKHCILGGGVAGLSLASFLDEKAVILERSKTLGGLSKSYDMNGVAYDIGPHIIFSKNKEVLDLHTSMVPTNRLFRSNQIFHKDRYIKYPFENDLGSLDPQERDYCLQEFLNNPYENYSGENMLQFFLKTFGEGITRTYLQPYNEKIWKFDPSMMDTQMVDRIPKPPKEDVINSANGIPTEGYKHQLYFHYPSKGGFQSLVDEYDRRAKAKGSVAVTDCQIHSLKHQDKIWTIETSQGTFTADRLTNCIPLHELFTYFDAPKEVTSALSALLYNSIHIVMVQVKKETIGNHFALYLPNKDIIFHRLSKLDFLGEEYKLKDGGSTLMAEVTFRPGSYISSLANEKIKELVIDGLVQSKFIDRQDVTDIQIRTEKYAYVIYDLNHRKNTDLVLGWLRSIGISSAGRFAEFEYLNTDGVVERTLKLAREYNLENRGN